MDRKETELERAEKRLKSLKKVKPAFIGQYEKLEGELRELHEMYIEKYRNLHYLETELEKYHKADRDKRDEVDRALKKMQRRLRAEELAILRGDEALNSDEGFDESVYDSGRDDDELGEDSYNQRGSSRKMSAKRRPAPARALQDDESSDESSFMDSVGSAGDVLDDGSSSSEAGQLGDSMSDDSDDSGLF